MSVRGWGEPSAAFRYETGRWLGRRDRCTEKTAWKIHSSSGRVIGHVREEKRKTLRLSGGDSG